MNPRPSDHRHRTRPKADFGQGENGPYIRRVKVTTTEASGGQPVEVKNLLWDGSDYAVYGDAYGIGDAATVAQVAVDNVLWIIWRPDRRVWEIFDAAPPTDVRIVTVDKESGSQDAGDPVVASSGRYFSGTLNVASDIWIYLNDHHDDLVDSAGPTDQPWLPALSEWQGLLQGTYDPDPEGDSDERPVYKIDGIPHGVIPGFCATAFSAASGQGGASPTFTTGSFQTYIEDETGAWGYGPLLTGVMYNLEEGVAAGVVGFVHRGRGKLWLMPSCKVGSGYSS